MRAPLSTLKLRPGFDPEVYNNIAKATSRQVPKPEDAKYRWRYQATTCYYPLFFTIAGTLLGVSSVVLVLRLTFCQPSIHEAFPNYWFSGLCGLYRTPHLYNLPKPSNASGVKKHRLDIHHYLLCHNIAMAARSWPADRHALEQAEMSCCLEGCRAKAKTRSCSGLELENFPGMQSS